MPKGKSSASSGTRKKHARKAAGPAPQEPPQKEKKPKGKDRNQKKEPRQKVYIPPVKPAPIQPDPLDTTGLAHHLPPDLLVVLRRFGKKDAVTKRRALEELQGSWVDRCKREGDDSPLVPDLVLMLPVWIHHIPALFLHPERRIRLLTAGLHSSLLHIPAIREATFSFVRETASTDQVESILGTWCMASHDIDRQLSAYAQSSWSDAIILNVQSSGKLVLDETLLQLLLSFIQRVLMDPSGVYGYLNPTPVTVVNPPTRKIPGRPTAVVPLKREDAESSRWKAEGEEENEQDRNARLRVGAFGALKWALDSRDSDQSERALDDLMPLLSNPALWSSFYHAETSPFVDIESFGSCQPSVRKSAWTLLQTLLRRYSGVMGPLLPMLSASVLRSAWVEPDPIVRGSMWQPLLMFLKEFPEAWELEMVFTSTERDNESSESESEKARDNDAPLPSNLTVSRCQSSAFQEFLQFLELGCSGSPLQGYPTILVILSTIPSSILASPASLQSSPLTDFFISFWAAIDGRALSSLERAATSAAFLSSLLECTVFLIRRLLSDSKDHVVLPLGGRLGEEESRKVVSEQFGRIWEELVTSRLRVEEGTAGSLIAQSLVKLDEIDNEFFRAAWNSLSIAIKDVKSATGLSLVSAVIHVFIEQFQDGTGPKRAALSLMKDVVHTSVVRCENALKGETPAVDDLQPLVNLVDTFGEKLFCDLEFAVRIDEMTTSNAYRLLILIPSLLLTYLTHRHDDDLCLQLWSSLLSAVSEHPDAASSTLNPLLDAAQRGVIKNYIKPNANELDALVRTVLSEVLQDPTRVEQLSLLHRILQTPKMFLSDNGFLALLEDLIHAFGSQVERALRDQTGLLLNFDASMDLIRVVFDKHPHLTSSTAISMHLLPYLCLFGYLLPRCDGSQYVQVHTTPAQMLWVSWLEQAPVNMNSDVLTAIKAKLREFLSSTEIRPRPEDILSMATDSPPGLKINLLDDIFPSRSKIDSMLDDLPSDAIDPSLAVLEPLIPPSSITKNRKVSQTTYDGFGYSSYARVVSALLHVFLVDRLLAKENMWALRHILALSLFAGDFLQIQSAHSPVFDQPALQAGLGELISECQQITTYLLTSSVEDGWHLQVVGSILKGNYIPGVDDLGKFVVDLVDHSKSLDSIRAGRILHNVLQHIVSNADKQEAEQWILIARKIEKSAPETSMAIVSSVTTFAPEPERLDRYRNELAADMLGIPASKANTAGLLLLRRLAATAPDPVSDVVFLPRLRAINVMKAFQQWISSDEDIDEEVECAMTLIFFHLAPILQNFRGAHWDLMFDVIESNLENCSFADDPTLVTLARTLKLIITVQDLASTNKTLRADWREREMTILTLVRDLVAVPLDYTWISAPRSTCREMALSIVQGLPASLIDHETLPKMCHLLTDPSTNVQKMAYRFLQESARKRTEHLVIEAGVDVDGTVKTELPLELMEILQRNLHLEDDDEQNLFGYLLAWMIVFDLFKDASLKVRSNYIDQLRNLGIIEFYFIPNVFTVLMLYEGISKAFKLDTWAVEDFYVEFYEPEISFSSQLLAAHLYYRALLVVPSLIRSWVADCKDRQLHTTVVTYTSHHFSPVIIRTELAHVKSPEAAAELLDENMTIKVSNAVNEVTASYLIDEHQLEITLKMPSDWPLHGIEIKDKRVAVVESRWRAWVLGVQQIIWSQNGRIVDGLSLFKKNVSLHFEGKVECAICYSIISVTDGSLPRKPCKTCKNSFHSGCLYKWFNTSHSSSCPLCRSDMV